MPRQITDIANDLITLYRERFGGKVNGGRFKITKASLMHLSARSRLQETIIDQLRETMLQEGYSFIKIYEEDEDEGEETSFVVIDNSIFTNYRQVPLRLIRQCIRNAEEEDDA